MKNLFLFLLFSSALRAVATEKIYLYSPSLGPTQIAAITITNANSKNMDELYLQQNPSSEIKDALLNEYAKAQNAFLTSEMANIESIWLDVLSFSTKADWSDSQRLLISTAYLRLAQSSANPERTRTAIQNALLFDYNYKPDNSLFPPPIVDLYNKLKSNISRSEFSTKNFIGFHTLLVNGQKVPLTKSSFLLPDGVHRFTWLSSIYKPVTKVMDSREIEKINLERIPFLTGSCENPVFNGSSQIRIDPNLVVAHFVEDCQTPLSGAHRVANVKLAERSKLSDLSPKANFSNDFDKFGTNDFKNNSEKAFYQKPKFWIRTALVVGAILVIKRNSDDRGSSNPSHKEGF